MGIPQFWRLRRQNYRLIGEICKCGNKIFPPRDVCPECAKSASEAYTLSGIVSPDITFHFPGNTMAFEAYKRFVYGVYEALPDLGHKIEDLTAEGDRVVMRETDSATHKGEFVGVTPTGEKVTVSAIGIFAL